MIELIDFITGGAQSLTDPRVMVGLIVFCMFLDGFLGLLGNLSKGVRR